MERQIPLARLVGSALLGVLAASSFVFAVLLLFAAWATGSALTGWVGVVGTGAVLTIALLAFLYAAAAAYAARQEWLARPIGRVIGLVVAIVAVLAAAITLMVGHVTDAEIVLYLAAGLGIATVIPLLVPEPRPAPRMEGGRS